jgi:hypothetical protein
MMLKLRTLLTLLLILGARAGAAEPRTGEQIYRQACAYCHGKTGEGTKKHPHPLVGDKSPGQLTKVIAKTMPENDPGSLSAEEAKRVSAYVYDAFYSPDALARNKPPRVELSRLTVRQYRNAVADVIGGFRAAPAKWDDKRGLRGEYFDSRNFRNDKRAIDRLDPEVRFDFGVNSPVEKKIDAAQFAIRWGGSLLAPETGVYEFTIRTDQAARLWVNDPNKPLIDAWVKSGNDLEHKATLFLLAGRTYPVRLEFSKAKQGVDDSKTKKPKPRNAMVALEWKPPHGTTGTIPARCLSPASAPETFAVETSFPPDDRSYGWERANTVSKAWDAATTDAAIETADYVANKLNQLANLGGPPRRRARNGNPASIDLRGSGGPKVPQSEREKKLRDFCERFAERAFRRPLSTEQKAFFIDRQFAEVRDPDAAVKRVVLLVLKSPRFLYREVGGGPDAYDVASRLSFALWDSIPDRELLDAAKAGKLSTREQVAKQAERMLNDPRAHAKLQRFLLTWLKLDAAPEISKDAKRYPDFNAALVADLRTSLGLFLDDVVWGSSSDFRRLLQSDEVYLNGRLAKFYGAKLPADAKFQKVKLDAGRRAGVLTHPYLMSSFAYTADSSPIHRGVFLARGVLGVTLRPPPDAFTPLPASLHPTLTTRERITLQTKPQACITCHGVINPLGFTLEHFDAVGRYRDKDHGKPVDATGHYETRAGDLKKFTGVDDLAKFLADSGEVHTAFVTQLFHNLVQQPVRAYGLRRPEELRTFFAHSGFNIRKLAVEIATTAALTGREPKQQVKQNGHEKAQKDTKIKTE